MKKLVFSIMLFAAFPALAQDYTPLQQYLYNESGYAPPVAAAPPPQENYVTAYVPTQPIDNDQYDDAPEDESTPNSGDELRDMLISVGN